MFRSVMATYLCFTLVDCRDVLLPLVTDQLSGQLDDHSNKPDHEACVQLLSTVLDILDRKDVVRRRRTTFYKMSSKSSQFSEICFLLETYFYVGGCQTISRHVLGRHLPSENVLFKDMS